MPNSACGWPTPKGVRVTLIDHITKATGLRGEEFG